MTPSITLTAGAGALIGAAAGTYAAATIRRTHRIPRTFGLLAAALGLLLGLAVAVRIAPAPLAATVLVLLAAALPLSAIDATTRTLPDRLLLPAIPACAALLALAAAQAEAYGPLWRALTASALVFLAFTTLSLTVPGQLGFGDCKAAALCALPLGYLGWNRVLLGILAAYLFAAAYIIGRRLITRNSHPVVAFGPFLFAGTLTTLLLA